MGKVRYPYRLMYDYIGRPISGSEIVGDYFTEEDAILAIPKVMSQAHPSRTITNFQVMHNNELDIPCVNTPKHTQLYKLPVDIAVLVSTVMYERKRNRAHQERE